MNYGPGQQVEYREEASMQDWKSGGAVHWPVSQNFILIDITKFNLCLSNFCHQNFQNIVTWGVELQSRNTIFACISMESLISGVLGADH